jgi:hypothetical protein
MWRDTSMARLAPAICGFIFVIITTLAWGQADLPNELQEDVPVYPNGEILDLIDREGVTQILLKVEDPPKRVIGFYKEAMGKNGWEIVTEVPHEKGVTVLLSKKGKMLLITADASAGKATTVMVNLAE